VRYGDRREETIPSGPVCRTDEWRLFKLVLVVGSKLVKVVLVVVQVELRGRLYLHLLDHVRECVQYLKGLWHTDLDDIKQRFVT